MTIRKALKYPLCMLGGGAVWFAMAAMMNAQFDLPPLMRWLLQIPALFSVIIGGISTCAVVMIALLAEWDKTDNGAS